MTTVRFAVIVLLSCVAALLVGCEKEEQASKPNGPSQTDPRHHADPIDTLSDTGKQIVEARRTEPLEQAEGVQLAVFKVEGMTCGGCENAVRTKLASLEGVIDASVSHTAERAWVHISDDAPLTVEQISEALGDLPFESAPMTEEATDENEQPVKEDQPQALFMAPANTSTNSSVMTHPHEEDGFAPLFDGKTLDAFTIEGGKAKYKVADGVIVGHSVPNTPNTFLTTKKVYGDFILEYEFKNDPALNSGVQVRSHAYDESKTYDIDGKERKIAAGRMHGYQIEIDTNPDRNRMWSAGVFEEGRRGWLYPGKMGGDGEKFTEQGRKLTKVAEWNTVRVEARGNTIKTYLNGELRTDMTDTWNGYDKTGHIAFQVHGVGKREEPMYVSWRNLRIKELK